MRASSFLLGLLSLVTACGPVEVPVPATGPAAGEGASDAARADGSGDGSAPDGDGGDDANAAGGEQANGAGPGSDSGSAEGSPGVDGNVDGPGNGNANVDPAPSAGSDAMSVDVPPEPASEIAQVEGGQFVSGAAPPGDATPEDAPSGMDDTPPVTIVAISAPEAATNGSTVTLLVQLSAPVASPELVVALEGDAGYHRLQGSDPDGDGVVEVKVEVAEAATTTSLDLRVALVGADGSVGEYQPVVVRIVESGVGDVKITLSYQRTHDLDLHVFEPGGEQISFQNPASANGGRLDLDSGSNCSSASTAENVFWGAGDAPAGTYRVVVSNYEQCSPGSIDFSVRVSYDGRAETFQGSFADGTAGTLVEVTSFTR